MYRLYNVAVCNTIRREFSALQIYIVTRKIKNNLKKFNECKFDVFYAALFCARNNNNNMWEVLKYHVTQT